MALPYIAPERAGMRPTPSYRRSVRPCPTTCRLASSIGVLKLDWLEFFDKCRAGTPCPACNYDMQR